MVFENRWYDKNPKVSLAVDCIKDANPELRNKLAKLIIKQAMEMGIKAKKPSPGLFRRWYDKDPTLSLAMEYFKNCDDKQRLEITQCVTTYIQGMLIRQNLP